MTDSYGPLEIPGHRLERLLGSGGFADVYLYTQEMLHRPVAVKIIREQVEQGSVRAQFATEANLMAQLASHPSIVTIFSADVSEGGRPYIMMEYCSRPSLAERYKSRALSVAEMLQTMIRLCGAVETAHRAGILHRDIKPANILTTDYGWPALTDFGISAIVGEATIGGGGMSVPWSPPEAFTGSMSLDARSDVYSLAATAYTVLAGHSPFDDAAQSLEMGAFVYRILESPVPPLSRSDVPDTLERLLTVALAKNPDDRPPSAALFARALQRIEQDLMLPATPLDVPDELVDDLERTQTRMRGRSGRDATIARSAISEPAVDPDPTIARTADRAADEVDQTVVLSPRHDRPPPDDRSGVDEDNDIEDVTRAVSSDSLEAPEDATVVIDRLDDRTVVVDRLNDRTVVVDRDPDHSTSLLERPEQGGKTTLADVPLRAQRIAYVPDQHEIERYRARRAAPRVEPTRVTLEPPPQRASSSEQMPSTTVQRSRQRSLVGLLIGLSISVIALIGGVTVVVLVLVNGDAS